MLRLACVCAWVVLLGLVQVSLAQDPNKNDVPLQLTPQQWQEDLQFLAKELPRRHKNAFHTVSRQQFEKAVAELNSEIPNLPSHEIVIGLMHLVASVGDAHTELTGFAGSFHRFPLSVSWFERELRVTRIAHEYKSAIGARVVQVGDLRI